MIIGWFLFGNIAGLLTPLIDLMHRLFNLAPVNSLANKTGSDFFILAEPKSITFANDVRKRFWDMDWNVMLLLQVSRVQPLTNLILFSPNSKPKLFICVALVCTICGLCLNVLLAIIAGQMAGLFSIPRLSSFADFSIVLEK